MSKEEEKTLELEKFDVQAMKPYSITVIFGKRNTGKSTLIKDILYNNRHKFPTVVVFCPSEPSNNFYKNIVPDSFIYEELDLDAFNNILNRQDKILKSRPPWFSTVDEGSILVIMDDCMDEPKEKRNSDIVKKIYKRGRHLKITLMVVVQYLKDLPPDLRNNCDYIFVLKETSNSMQNAYYEYLGGFDEKKEFKQAFTTLTDKYGALVKNCVTTDTSVTGQFFWYKASIDIPPFRLGERNMWPFHNHHYIAGESGAGKTDWGKVASDASAQIPDAIDFKNESKGKSKKSADKTRPFTFIKMIGADGEPIQD